MAIIKSEQTTLCTNRNEHYKKALISVIVTVITYLIVGKILPELTVFTFAPLAYTLYQLNKASIFSYGIRGEKKVLKQLKMLPDDYIIYNDIDIPYGDGKKSQIDHLIISPKGIFCIETKNMKGTIFGSEDDKYWTQKKVGRKGGVYYKNFYSPIKQNIGHIYSLKNVMRKNKADLFVQSVIVFTRVWTSRIKVNTSSTPVIKVNRLVDYIINNSSTYPISNDKLKRLEETLDSLIKEGKIDVRRSETWFQY